MEELSNLIWIGGLLAMLGPPRFKELWSHLQPALQHYMYGFNASVAEMCAAAERLRKYACKLEQLVKEDKVCSCTALTATVLESVGRLVCVAAEYQVHCMSLQSPLV